MKRIPLIAALALALAGCAGGLDKFNADQLRSLAGTTGCSSLKSVQGNASTIVVGADDIKRGQSGKYKVTISPDCSVTIESEVASQPAGGSK